MKPIFNRVAKQLKEENEKGIIAFVDATKERKLAERFKIKGFPTVKYFQVIYLNHFKPPTKLFDLMHI